MRRPGQHPLRRTGRDRYHRYQPALSDGQRDAWGAETLPEGPLSPGKMRHVQRVYPNDPGGRQAPRDRGDRLPKQLDVPGQLFQAEGTAFKQIFPAPYMGAGLQRLL